MADDNPDLLDVNRRSPGKPHMSPVFRPELHPLDAEWYFTADTSSALAERLGSGPVCLFGAPTVACAMKHERYELVDTSPFLAQRFPDIKLSNISSLDLDREHPSGTFRAVLLDPPWYHPSMERWVWNALACMENGGRIFMPLLGEGTRPTAAAERANLVAHLRTFGDLKVIREDVEYDIPLFEERALLARNITLTQPWRIADLAVLTVSSAPQRRKPTRSLGTLQKSAWETFLVGGQVIKLRRDIDRERIDGQLLSEVDGVAEYNLDSVSARDSRLRKIDIWTSRNRVARVVDRAEIRQQLHFLAASGGLYLSNADRPHDIAPELADFLELNDA
ncbi:hypothetical protein [Flexivirga oryzae]|uniref:Class I SAM-dependent methyltransferase n=1 Tax=Flexivirga oryzae TaxID=1794944 RepID=A0A839N6U1_9MICO|nr:hypothetical protein [Flexivirga oryzae]MBB2893460.1 hypothetical protein [Flexivirga oryzae]